ncbi:hypothetical protein SAMN04488503_0069 [Humidesulfovibrio mexicanus]|uniref:Membrane protein YfhO n=2 Tax=Humidesulfovibrio mexicanus TaxID=147047 RepID=A0A239D0X1_9BACT|nr:hypothetical protein SAMN04488503_0069 [Humidesulfovibrio mexicanus]
MPATCSTLAPNRRDLFLFLALAILCYADKIVLGPLAFVDIYDSLEVHFVHFRNMWKLWTEFGPFSWYPFHAGGAPSFAGQHPPWHPAVLLAGMLPLWLLSLLWNIGQMCLAGYGMSRFLPLLFGISRRSALLAGVLFSITWVSGNVHFVMSYAFPAVFVWCVELCTADSSKGQRVLAAICIALASVFSFPVLTLPHFPVFHLALVLLLGRHLPDFRRQVAGVFLVWTGFVLLFSPTVVSLFEYIPYAQRQWDFAYPGHWPALLSFFKWLKGRLADQQLIALLIMGLPFLSWRPFRVSALLGLGILLVSGVFSSDLKGLFAGSFLLKMDLFMFATCLGLVSAMLAGLALEALTRSDKGVRWPLALAALAVLPCFGAAHKVLAYAFFLGAGLAGVCIMRRKQPRYPSRAAIALMVCLAAAAMLTRQQFMTSGMFAPYAQGMKGHDSLAALAETYWRQPFRTACVDVHPVVAQNLGFDTVGGKGPLFNKHYKDLVGEALRPQLNNAEQFSGFNTLWRQLYLTRLHTDHDQRSWVLDKAPLRDVADFNWNLLYALNVSHVLSDREIGGMSAVAGRPTLSPGFGEQSSFVARLGLSSTYSLPLYLYGLKDPLPRVRLTDPLFVPQGESVPERMGRADLDELRRVAYLTQAEARFFPPPPPLRRFVPEFESPVGTVRLAHWSPDRIRVNGIAERPCVLLLANNFDPGWKAVLSNGTVLPTFRANHAFLGVRISEPGPFSLAFVYSAPHIWWLCLASAFGLGLLFVPLAWPVSERPFSAPAILDQEAPAFAVSRKTALLCGIGAAAVWALAFGLFVMGRHKGPQSGSLGYALWSIPSMGVLVACWTRALLRRI